MPRIEEIQSGLASLGVLIREQVQTPSSYEHDLLKLVLFP